MLSTRCGQTTHLVNIHMGNTYRKQD